MDDPDRVVVVLGGLALERRQHAQAEALGEAEADVCAMGGGGNSPRVSA